MPHDLRASYATWFYDMGSSPVEIGGRLGHASATVTTKHYARRVAGRHVEIADGLEAMHRGRSGTAPGVGRRLLGGLEFLQELGAKGVLCQRR